MGMSHLFREGILLWKWPRPRRLKGHGAPARAQARAQAGPSPGGPKPGPKPDFPCPKMAPRTGAIHAPEQMRHGHIDPDPHKHCLSAFSIVLLLESLIFNECVNFFNGFATRKLDFQ